MAVKITKIINTSKVLKTIWKNRDISRIDIAKKLNLDKSTVTVIVNNLIKKQYVLEVAQGESGPKGGRKPVKLKINKLFGSVAGIEMHPNFYQAILINLEGDVINSLTKQTPINQKNFLDCYNKIIKELCHVKGEIPPLLGVGLGTSGIVDSQSGTIIKSIPLNVNNFPVKQVLEKAVNIPIMVENDANACCWGEMIFHKEYSLKNFLFVLVEFHGKALSKDSNQGISIGIGFVFNGKIHYGQNHSAGEFKSIQWSSKNKSQFSISNEETYMVESEEQIFNKFALELSNHLAFLVNTLNLNHIFLGGDIEKYKETFTPILKNSIRQNWPYEEDDKCSIQYSSFGKSAVAHGAAAMILNRLFVDRELVLSLYN